MLITDSFAWSFDQFEAYVEGMCEQLESFPNEKVAFWAPTTIETILTLFAIWKLGKIACPLSPRLPKVDDILKRLKTELFAPQIPMPAKPTFRPWNLDRLATCLLTSGSTGMPKIACHTLSNHYYSALGSNQLIPLDPMDRWALTLPLFHVGGLGILFRSYLAKATVVLSSHLSDATHISFVPTQLYKLLDQPQEMPRLKTILLGGAPLPDIETPWNVVPTYGMTEMSSQIITGGVVHPYAEVRFAQDHEIFVRGKVLFQGYLDAPLQNDWFPTGDLGLWQAERFTFLGRKDNLFISGGENIQPEEIEMVIRKLFHFESIVVPTPDRLFGQRPAIFLADPTLFETIQKTLQELLPKFKIPIRAFQMPPASGLKPNRKQLAAIALEQYTFS